MKIKEIRHVITADCNLFCKHCYLRGGSYIHPPYPDFSQEELDRFYSFFKPEIVSATGGEPLLRKNFIYKIARSLKSYGGKIEIVTNGFFIDAKFVKKIHLINENVFYQISLDGLENYHNFIRGNHNAFKKAIDAINLVSEKGTHTKVRMTITNDNFKEIPEIIDLLDSFNRTNISLIMRPIVQSGRAIDNHLEIFSDDFTIFEKFLNLPENIKIETTDLLGKCGCGVNTLAVDPLGNIYPCSYFIYDLLHGYKGNPEFRMGKITGDLTKIKEHEKFVKFKGVCYARSKNVK